MMLQQLPEKGDSDLLTSPRHRGRPQPSVW